MSAVGELVLVLGLLVSAHCEVRARDPEVEEELGEGGLPPYPGVTETPLLRGTGRSPARTGVHSISKKNKSSMFSLLLESGWTSDG
ncbi:hypothetical protein GOODEAATRI_025007 [Goodea atripinnis]|uniref:Uncharacterized protein n=1 Tax=Goodea atripinnis TaxID=208336 RepID=A0ABV0NXG1_9TELE